MDVLNGTAYTVGVQSHKVGMKAVVELSDFLSYEWGALLESSSKDIFASFFLHPFVPLTAVLMYWYLSAPVCQWVRRTFDLAPKGRFIQTVTILHSGALALYSLWTFVNTVIILNKYMQNKTVMETLCDYDETLWDVYNIGFWCTHFYLSKYYEFIDTWILHLKGREPGILQTYHHAGIVLCMWAIVVTKSGSAVVTTVFNSFIHTIMYTYYVFAALGYSSSLKHYLTQAQMIQLITGCSVAVAMAVTPNCMSPAEGLSTLVLNLYAFYLIYLFYDFYTRTYKQKGEKKKSN